MVAIVAGNNIVVSPLPGGAWRIEKVAGVAGAYDAAAASESAITGDFAVRAIDLGEANSFLFGVSGDPGGDDSFGAINYASWIYGGDAYVFESGAYVPPMRACRGTAWITRTGSVLRYHLGHRPTALNTVRTVTGVTGPLWFDCTIGKLGGAFSARFDTPGGWSRAGEDRRALSVAICG